MNRRKRPFWLLVISLLSLAGLLYLIFFLSPSHELQITNYQLPITIPFFFILFFFLFSLISYFLRNARRAALIGLLIITYFIFRILHLSSPYFLFLLIALFISLELFFKKRA
ncbi:MAG: hypothetical protein HYW62_03595 [Candidatus Levybacteria bacterium]|nr:hypothetical protein [Candidatus Levybacteria bacterium]